MGGGGQRGLYLSSNLKLTFPPAVRLTIVEGYETVGLSSQLLRPMTEMKAILNLILRTRLGVREYSAQRRRQLVT
jgi:hypothetical protein